MRLLFLAFMAKVFKITPASRVKYLGRVDGWDSWQHGLNWFKWEKIKRQKENV